MNTRQQRLLKEAKIKPSKVNIKVKKQKSKSDQSIDDFWQKFVRKGRGKREFERNVDLISVEESDSRIISFLITLALLVTIVATILTLVFIIKTNDVKTEKSFPIFSPNTHEIIGKMKVPNIAITYDNGTVIKILFENSLKITKIEKILQLPRSKKYFMFSYKGILYFVFAEPTRKMIQYHPTLNQKGHEVVLKSDIFPSFDERKLFALDIGIQVGNKFWLMKKRPLNGMINAFGMERVENSSYLWYHVRQKWIKGPDILLKMEDEMCLVSLNRSSVMLIGGFSSDPDLANYFAIRKVLVYDFETFGWSHYPDLNVTMYHCTAALYITKTYVR